MLSALIVLAALAVIGITVLVAMQDRIENWEKNLQCSTYKETDEGELF